MKKWGFPEPEAYWRFRNGQMTLAEQRTFITSLERFCEWFFRTRWHSLSPVETQDLAEEAILKHIEKFDSNLGRAELNLTTILHQMACDLVKSAPYRLTTSLEGMAENGFEAVSQFIEEVSRDEVPDVISLLESVERVEIFKMIYLRWNDLPKYPWKDTVHLYLQWWIDAGKTSTTKFIAYVKSVHGLKTRDQTIRDHINDGLKQLAKWVIHEEPLPVGLRKSTVIAQRSNQIRG